MRFTALRALRLKIVLLVLLLPAVSMAGDFPNGINTIGLVTNVGTFGGWTRVVVQGSVTYAFWIDATTPGGATHFANLLAAAAQGRQVNIWHYGEVFNFGGQTGYLLADVFVSY